MTSNPSGGEILQFPAPMMIPDPESEMARSQARQLREQAVDELPDEFRAIFVLREVEGMSTEEAASHLGIRPETAKTQLHRARRMMRSSIEKQLTGSFSALSSFDGKRCVAMANRVIAAFGSAAGEAIDPAKDGCIKGEAVGTASVPFSGRHL